jgi:radical SAM/Cys-rich protein
VVASLPCYLEENVDRQRGKGTFDASIRGLQRLNALGYAAPDSGLMLNLVFNPQGPTLPPPQEALTAAYREHLGQEFGIAFNELFTLSNMPIQRFGSMLISKGQFNSYMQLLRGAHRDENLEQVMCRNLLSIDWQGYLYDCDFNQQLGLPLGLAAGQATWPARPATPAHHRAQRRGPRRAPDPRRRSLLWLYGRTGVELRRRARRSCARRPKCAADREFKNTCGI